MTSTLLALLLPYDCCAHLVGRRYAGGFAIERRCGQCGTLGWTHSFAPEEQLRCLDCATGISECVKDRILQAGENR